MLTQRTFKPAGGSSSLGAIIPASAKTFNKYSHVDIELVSALLEKHIQQDFNIALLTVHGSHLYGFETETSDIDFYIVVDIMGNNNINKKLAKQFVMQTGDITFDINIVGWTHWVELLNKGRHQACEAFFSPYAYIHSNYSAYCDNFVPPRNAMLESFISVIKSFTVSGFNCPKNVALEDFVEPENNKRNVKKLRHAARLAKHVQMVYTTGGFNPNIGVEGLPDFDTITVKNYVAWLHDNSFFQIFDKM